MPETGETLIDLPAQPVGPLRFSCGMGMYGGVIEFVAANNFVPAQQQPASSAGVQVEAASVCDPTITTCLPTDVMPKRSQSGASSPRIGPLSPAQATAQASAVDGAQTINIQLVNGTYEPAVSYAKADVPSKLLLHTQNGFG